MFDYDRTAVASILGTSLDAAFTIDDHGHIVDINTAAVRMFGWSAEELLGANISIIVPSPLKEMHDGFLEAFDPGRGVKHVLGSGQRLNGQCKDGSEFPVEVGISSFVQQGKRYFAGFVRDMTARQLAEDRMRFLATHDTDTGLLNYRGLFSKVQTVRQDGPARVIFFRLDEFQRLARTYGKQWGDTALQQLSSRLQEFMHPCEIAARVSEDAFAILSPEDAIKRAELLQQILKHPVIQGSMRIPLTTTIGISLPAGSLEERLNAAQWACYGASCSRRGRINEYTDETGRLARRRLQIETRLRNVLHEGGLSLALQPKVRLSDRRITGAEALIRWTDPELGPIAPTEFIPVAERLGLIGGITDWMLRHSLAEVSRCADKSISVAVNFCALDFLQPDLIQNMGGTLSELKADPARLVIELTESVVAHDAALVNSHMQQVKALGAALSLDDFGTGYSSLSYLRQFPIDSLKIDISFVRDMPGKPDAVAITTAIVSMAQALGLETIAEGVENAEQAELLRTLNVDLCQGNLFSKPVPPVEFHRLLEAQHAWR